MTISPLRVGIVGAGPAGFYTAEALIKKLEHAVEITLFDRLPAPFGLVRYGVAPDHQKIKGVTKVFNKVAANENFSYRGNVELGTAITRDELLECFDAVVYCMGAQSDRRLGIDGEELSGSWSSTDLVAWYNGHPDRIEPAPDLSCSEAAVIGIGNVAMDVARILGSKRERLASTDIADHALETLDGSSVRRIHLLVRRGAAQAKCTPTELKELAHLEGWRVRLGCAGSTFEGIDDESLGKVEQKNMAILRSFVDEPGEEGEGEVVIHFLCSPLSIAGDGRIESVTVGRNELVERDGWIAPEPTGETFELPVGLVVRAVGYRSLPVAGLPFNDRKAVVPNQLGRIDERPREYVAGWLKRGPSGLIGTNKKDAVETVTALVEDLEAGRIEAGVATADSDAKLAERGIESVDWPAWQRLDQIECAAGEAEERPRVKRVSFAAMLEATKA